MELSSFLCIIQDGCEEIQNAPLYSVVSTAAKERHQELLTFRSKPNRDNELWRRVTLRQLFLHLYREHKLGGDKTEMFLSHDEHLVAVQLSIAAWNKKERGTFEADPRLVSKISKAVLKRKMEKLLPCALETTEPSSPLKTSSGINVKTPRRVRSTPFRSPFRTPSSDKRSGFSEHLSRTPGSSSKIHGRAFPATTPQSHPPGMLQMVDSPRTPLTDIGDDTVVDVLSLYDEFIQKCGKVDVLDVFTRVKEFFEQNNNELVIFKKEHVLVIDKLPRDQIEREMLKCLVGDDSVCCISTKEIPMEGLCWMKDRLGGCDIVKATVPLSFLWRSTDLAGYLCREPETALSVSSVSEKFIRKLFLSYVSLLVNSADELALARCLCLPDSGLGHQGFTALKHLATKKKMSMFLTAFSFVFEMRRVKTTSDSYSPLFEHAKALSEFVDIADKLLTITQDIADVDLAARKVLKTLKCTLSKSRTCSLRQASMKIVCEELLEETKHLLEAQIVDLKITPKPVGSGGSMRGQKVLRLFRTLLDVEATNVSQNQGQDELVDQQASQGTPVRFPSLLSQFRSPSVQELPPTEKLLKLKRNTPVSYTKSHYGWVAPSLILADELQPLGASKQISVPSSEECGSSSPTEVLREISHNAQTDKKPDEVTIKETEGNVRENDGNITEETRGRNDKEEGKVTGRNVSTPSAGKVVKNKKPSLKRKKLELEADAVTKKPRTDKKKKNHPLIKGQGLLTKFFRK
ncbi:UPF0419 protein C12orf48-like protein [Apostichopus japonicus]|uniref:PCNA-interacting partner n=1 Tax=Stichopus japonicus TaxID=307972 RepID=A0A2G8JVY6_STIJA|nr:UPF0419 protein C12orf48-like protein [Apostichopus japonicus]